MSGGMTDTTSVLLDTTSSPAAREVIGSLLAVATHADIAVRNIRLAALDLSADETRGIARCRVLIGQLDVNALSFPGIACDEGERLRVLLDFVTSDRVEVRSAGMGVWLPDFSVYRRTASAGADAFAACLVGAHYFHARPAEPAFTCVLREPQAVRQARRRFDGLWAGGHDVREAVIAAITSTGRFS